jgi:NAD(P)-dependent dehydrogenase (short-subunit alcohol dehydrogenase family)
MNDRPPRGAHPEDYPRAALITGAGRRIGRAIALDLARHDWAVALHYNRSKDDAEVLAREIEVGGGRAVAFDADLSLERESAALVPRTVEVLGPLGCLVNNASVFTHDHVETASRESWDWHIEANLRAPLVLTQAFARALPEPLGGAVVNLLDQRVWNLTPHFLSYTVSKSALWTLTRTLALALAPRIRVNAIGPGPTLPSEGQTQAQFDAQCASLPLGRGAMPEEIAQGVRFLLAAGSMTGQMIALDGGQHLGWAQPGQDTRPEE